MLQSSRTTSRLVQWRTPSGSRGIARRSKPYSPNFFKTPACNMAAGAGAAAYASGAQVWNGKSETRIPKPTSSSKAILATPYSNQQESGNEREFVKCVKEE